MKKSNYLFVLSLIILGLCYACEKDDSKINDGEIVDGKFTDSRDGKSYKAVKIGEAFWMGTNLSFEAGEGSLAYNNNEDNADTYGRLYNYETAKTACPTGWHLPSEEEWETLLVTVQGDDLFNEYVGERLKATSGWKENGDGIDAFDFTALPGGRSISETNFYGEEEQATWWSGPFNDGSMLAISLTYSNSGVSYVTTPKEYGLSVRCVQN